MGESQRKNDYLIIRCGDEKMSTSQIKRLKKEQEEKGNQIEKERLLALAKKRSGDSQTGYLSTLKKAEPTINKAVTLHTASRKSQAVTAANAMLPTTKNTLVKAVTAQTSPLTNVKGLSQPGVFTQSKWDRAREQSEKGLMNTELPYVAPIQYDKIAKIDKNKGVEIATKLKQSQLRHEAFAKAGNWQMVDKERKIMAELVPQLEEINKSIKQQETAAGLPTGLGERISNAVIGIGEKNKYAIPVIAETGKVAIKNATTNFNNQELQELNDRAVLLKSELGRMIQYNYATPDEAEGDGRYLAKVKELNKVIRQIDKKKVAQSVDPNSKAMINYNNTRKYLEKATAGLNGPGKVIGDTLVSVGDNLSTMPLAAINPWLSLGAMGTKASADRMYELNNEGKSAGEAFARGTTSGVIEVATEKMPLDNLMEAVKSGKMGAKSFLKQMGIEATEEGVSYFMNYVADNAAKDPDAYFDPKEFALSMVEGGLSGLIFAGGGAAVGKVMNSGNNAVNTNTEHNGESTEMLNETTPLIVQRNNGLTQQGEATVLPTITQEANTIGSTYLPTINSVETVRSGRNLGVVQKTYEEVASIADKLKRNVVFFEGEEGNQGYLEDGVIYINKNSKSPAWDVFKHEFTHTLQNKNGYNEFAEFMSQSLLFNDYLTEKGFVDSDGDADFISFVEEIKKVYGEKGQTLDEPRLVEEAMARFVQDSNLFTSEESISRLVKESPTMADRILSWIKDMIATFKGTPQEKELRKAERLYINAKNSGDFMTEESGRQNAIIRDGNKAYVKESRNIPFGTDTSGWANDAGTYIYDNILKNGKLDVETDNGEILTINGTTEYKLVGRDKLKQSSGRYRDMTDEEYKRKLTMAGHIDEIAQTSLGDKKNAVADSKNHIFAKDGFNSRRAYFENAKGDYFKMLVSVGNNGEVKTVYNINKIEKMAKRNTTHVNGSSSAKGGGAQNGASGISNLMIAQKNSVINNNIRKNGGNDTQNAFDVGTTKRNTTHVKGSSSAKDGGAQNGVSGIYDTRVSQRNRDVNNNIDKSNNGNINLEVEQKVPVSKNTESLIKGSTSSTMVLQNSTNVNDKTYKSLEVESEVPVSKNTESLLKVSTPNTRVSQSNNIVNNNIRKNGEKGTQNAFDVGTNESRGFVSEDSELKKSVSFRKRAANYFLADFKQGMGISKYSDTRELKGVVDEICKEVIEKGQLSGKDADRLFGEMFDRGVIVNRNFYDENKNLKSLIKQTKFYVNDSLKKQISDFNDFKKANFAHFTTTDDLNATKIDSFYKEMAEIYPEFFPEDITTEADQLQKIAEVGKSIKIAETEINQLAQDSVEYKKWAKGVFEEGLQRLEENLQNVMRYNDQKTEQAAQKQYNKDMKAAVTPELAKELYSNLSTMKRELTKLKNKELMGERERNTLNRLVRGEITMEQLPQKVNVGAIRNLYPLQQKIYDTENLINSYRAGIKENYRQTADNYIENSDTWKDKPHGWQYSREIMERNIEDIVKDKAEARQINEEYFTPIHANEAEATRLKNKYREQIKNLKLGEKERYRVGYIVEERKLPEFSTVSERALVQLLGEGKINEDTIKRVGADVGKIKNAVLEFRSIYNELLEEANNTLVANGYAPVEYRKDYFPHFTETKPDSVLGKIGNALGIHVQAQELPTDIAGLTHTFKPGKRWVGNFLQRMGDTTDFDAVKGFDRYIEGVADVIYHTEDIQKLRALENAIRYKYSDDGLKERIDEIYNDESIDVLDKMNQIEKLYRENEISRFPHLVDQIRIYTDNLAGKQDIRDRNFERDFNRKSYELVRAVEGRIAANMVAVNPGSWLTNFIPLTQVSGIVSTPNLLKGIRTTMYSQAKSDGFAERSDFLTNRKGSEPLVRTKLETVQNKLASPMGMIDSFTAEAVVRSKYYDNVSKGMSEAEALADADKWAARLMADRSKGSMPTAFNRKSPIAKAFTMFQLEVNNQYSYFFKDVPEHLRERGLGVLLGAFFKMFLGGFLYNEAYERFTGRRCAFDPFDLMRIAVNNYLDEDKSTFEKVIDTGKNVVEELPFIGTLAGGGRLPVGSVMPNMYNTAKAVTGLATGEMNSKKAVSEIGKEMAKPAAYLLPPVGGGQIKKALEGISTIRKGGSYGMDSNGDPKLQFPVENPTPGTYAKAALFGKYAIPEAKDYVDSGFRSLSSSQTKKYHLAVEAGISFNQYMGAFNGCKNIDGDKDGNGNPINPGSSAEKNGVGKSSSLKKKEVIDGVEGLNKEQRKVLYDANGVSEKVW